MTMLDDGLLFAILVFGLIVVGLMMFFKQM